MSFKSNQTRRGKWSVALNPLIVGLAFIVACNNPTPTPADTTPPVVTITSPANNASISSTSVTVSGTATDASGVASLEYALNGGARATVASGAGFTFTASGLLEGDNTVTVFASDPSGNAAQASVTVKRTVTSTSYTLSVTKTGTGTGVVSSDTGGVNCGSTCAASYASGSSVTLSAIAATGSSFAGWSGACSGTATCTVAVGADLTVTARFESAVIGDINEIEPNDTPAEAQTVPINARIVGAITGNADVDHYAITVPAGSWLKLDLDAQSLTPASSLDGVLQIFDSSGLQIARNDNTRTWSSGSRDPFIVYRFTAAGTYTIRVSSANAGSAGAYTLTAQAQAPAWTLRAVGGNYREISSTGTRVSRGRVSLELRDLDAPTYGPSGGYPVTITGPSGWNGGQPYTVNATWFGDYRDLNPPAAITPPGTYTASVTLFGTAYTTTFTIDPSSALTIPDPVTLSAISASGVTATWTASPGASRYLTVLLEDATNATVAVRSTIGAGVAFTGLNITTTKRYRVEVNAYRDNGIELAFLNNIAFDSSANRSATFTLGNTPPPAPSFTLETLYPQAGAAYPVPSGADALHYVKINRLNGFTTTAQNFDTLEFTGPLIGTAANQVKVIFSKSLSSADNLAFVLVAGASAPLGEVSVNVIARGGGVTSGAATVKVLVTPCSSGC